MSDPTPMFPGGPWWPMSEAEEANWRAIEAQDRREGRTIHGPALSPAERRLLRGKITVGEYLEDLKSAT